MYCEHRAAEDAHASSDQSIAYDRMRASHAKKSVHNYSLKASARTGYEAWSLAATVECKVPEAAEHPKIPRNDHWERCCNNK